MAEQEIESVWDYPRPPRLEPVPDRLRVEHAGQLLAETTRGWRVLETSHPPVFYFPELDVRWDLLRPSAHGGSFCEWKGVARYWDLVPPEAPHVSAAAWSYAAPSRAFAALRNAVAFYASRVDRCFVGDEQVLAQPGDFYGGWITSRVRGPFKGGPGTVGW